MDIYLALIAPLLAVAWLLTFKRKDVVVLVDTRDGSYQGRAN